MSLLFFLCPFFSIFSYVGYNWKTEFRNWIWKKTISSIVVNLEGFVTFPRDCICALRNQVLEGVCSSARYPRWLKYILGVKKEVERVEDQNRGEQIRGQKISWFFALEDVTPRSGVLEEIFLGLEVFSRG